MILPVVFVALCLAAWAVVRVRRAARRRADADPVVTTWPGIELSEEYGGWNPGAYDAGTGHDRSVDWRSRSTDFGQRAATPKPGSWARRR